MKLVTFSHLHRTAPDRNEGRDTHVGVYLPMQDGMSRVLNLEAAHEWLNKKDPKSYSPPMSMLELLDGGPDAMERVRGLVDVVTADEEGLWESTQEWTTCSCSRLYLSLARYATFMHSSSM